MTVMTTLVLSETPQLRPLNILRDLASVADLVESCFAGAMDIEGQRYIQQMRRASRDNRFLRWATTAVETVSMPLSGYVWEENREVVGNVSLIPYHQKGRKIYLIANVAVHPNYRRQGIARALTVAAMHHALRRKADSLWLHVRNDNPGAAAMYNELGFRERVRRTTWQAVPDRNASTDGLGIEISPRYARDWPRQREWLEHLYPEELAWYQPLPWMSLRAGLWPSLYRFFVDYETRQWAARAQGRLLGALAWQPVYGHADRLWAAIPPEGGGRALTALLLHARRNLIGQEVLALDFPTGKESEAITAAGFYPRRTLIWMEAGET